MTSLRPTVASILSLKNFLSTGIALLIGGFATGGEVQPALLLAVPIAAVFMIADYLYGLLALCGALSGVTGVYALINWIFPEANIAPAATYLFVSVGAIGIAAFVQQSGLVANSPIQSRPMATNLIVLLTTIVAGYVVFRWTSSSDLQFLNSMAGSEDNAAWISTTRTFLSGEMTTDYLAHPTALSPVTGTTLGFVSDVYWIPQSEVPGHLLGLRALRAAYALVITLASITAALWVFCVATRAKVDTLSAAVASVVIGQATLGVTAFLFVGYGFFSFANAVLFALAVIIGFEVAYSQNLLQRPLEGLLLLVLSGFAGAWWGVAPLVAALIAVVITSPGFQNRWSMSSSKIGVFCHVGVLILALSTLRWTWQLSMNSLGVVGVTGTVPIVDTAWIPLMFLAVAALVSKRVTPDTNSNPRRRMPHLLLALYVAAVWSYSMWQFAEPRYAAYKILTLLSILSILGFCVVLVERVQMLGRGALVVGLALVLLATSIVHESHNGIRAGAGPDSPGTFQAKILDVLSESPTKHIVCLHQDPEQKLSAYLCSRLAASLSPGRAFAQNTWAGAMLNSDITPNGQRISNEDHVGSRVLERLQQELPNSQLIVILLQGDQTQGVMTDLGDDFWWVKELKWAEIQVAYL